MQKLKIFLIVLSILTFVSCSDDDPVSPPDDQPTALNAKAGLNQEAEVNETVTLDGSQSTGPDGFTYLWSYEGDVPEEEINFQNETSATPTFLPPLDGLYEFTLNITHGDSSDSDETTVVVGGAIKLNAEAGLNQEVSINETVTLDGSQSTGPDGFTYLWSYEGDVPEEEINFQNKTSATPTLVPPSAGLYEFTLTISHGDSTNSDQMTVIAGGTLKLGGTLTDDLELKNIQPDASKPDYIVTSDLIVPSGITLSIVEDDVYIEFEQSTGVHVDGGVLTNETENHDENFRTEFSGSNGWKGIWVNNGTINLNQSLINNAGNGKFNGSEEPAVITLSGTSTQLLSLSDNDFINSASYDIYVPDKFPEVSRSVARNKLSYRIPIKSVITFMGFWSSDNPNLSPEILDYFHLIPSGADTKDETIIADGFSFNPQGGKFYIDGDFWTDSRVSFGRNTKIYIKENCGILPDAGLFSSGTETEPIIISGLDGAYWKGIAHRTSSVTTISNTKIIGAGHGIINIGDFQAEEEAAIYEAYHLGMYIENSEIIGCNGYGYYNELHRLAKGTIKTTLFKDCNKGGIYINIISAANHLGRNSNNIFELDEGAAPVTLGEANFNTEDRIYGLGEGNYYLIDTEFYVAGDYTIHEGVHFKFKPGGSFTRGAVSVVTYFRIEGTADEPVIFEGVNETPGSWGGMMLAGYFQIENLIVRNGGGFILPGATEKANVVSNFSLSLANPSAQSFTNSEISNSGGWGIVVEKDTWNFEFDAPEKNNTFSNNTSGDIIIK